jgi:uncharacterized protein YqfB (UPF0267 family)
MVIGFKKQFVQPILDGTKIHTIREDSKCRWQPNKVMHMATGVRTKQYNCFKKVTCKHVQRIEIEPHTKTIKFTVNGSEELLMNDSGIETLAKNDGFKSVNDFWKWFDKPVICRIISWTDFKY